MIPDTLIQEVYTINNLVCTSNLDFPLTMDKIREEQDLKKKLQSLIHIKSKDITITAIGNTEVNTL